MIAIHNEDQILVASLNKLLGRLKEFQNSICIFVENGSQDSTPEIVTNINGKTRSETKLIGLIKREKGQGGAFKLGLENILLRPETLTKNHWVVLTSADLPFGFTDLDRFLILLESSTEVFIATGSKVHPNSKTTRSLFRKFLSLLYRVLRKYLLGMVTKDPQGSIFIRADLIMEALPFLSSTDFFFMTELIYHFEKRGVYPIEMPVVNGPQIRPSKIKPMTDGFQILTQLLWLAYRK